MLKHHNEHEKNNDNPVFFERIAYWEFNLGNIMLFTQPIHTFVTTMTDNITCKNDDVPVYFELKIKLTFFLAAFIYLFIYLSYLARDHFSANTVPPLDPDHDGNLQFNEMLTYIDDSIKS